MRARRRRSVDDQPLTNTTGTVLDPVFALRYRVLVPPGKVARVTFWTVVAESRALLLDLIDKHHDRNAFDRAKTLAWTQAQVQLRHLDVEAEEAADFQRLAAPVIYADRAFQGAVGRDHSRGRRAVRTVAARDFRRPADRAAAYRRRRRYRAGPAIVEGARVLADEAAGRRSRDRQRTGFVVHPGIAGRDRNGRAQQPVAAAFRRRTRARGGLYAARRFDERGGAGVAAIGRACRR